MDGINPVRALANPVTTNQPREGGPIAFFRPFICSGARPNLVQIKGIEMEIWSLFQGWWEAAGREGSARRGEVVPRQPPNPYTQNPGRRCDRPTNRGTSLIRNRLPPRWSPKRMAKQASASSLVRQAEKDALALQVSNQ